jgi:lipopolysaccharide/colanic/teichoic acid biosynthesis glycosyltransferase
MPLFTESLDNSPVDNAASRRLPGGLPRAVEVALALVGLCVIAPFLVVAVIAIAMSSPGPLLFCQQRVGRSGHTFTLFKLRSMTVANSGPLVTAGNDARITRVGRILRKTKLDEFPELWNIVKGDMSFVGPRPEVPRFVDMNDARWRRVLQARPGLTDPVTLRLRNEETLLAAAPGEREEFYRQVLQPYKLRGYLAYLQQRSWTRDVQVLVSTVIAVLMPRRTPPPTLEEIAAASGPAAN